jgi:hypothetical protein
VQGNEGHWTGQPRGLQLREAPLDAAKSALSARAVAAFLWADPPPHSFDLASTPLAPLL